MSAPETKRSGAVLTVIMLNTWRTHCAIVHENEHVPYERRTVQIKLTPEQLDALRPRVVGKSGGDDVFEERGPCWLEDGGEVPR